METQLQAGFMVLYYVRDCQFLQLFFPFPGTVANSLLRDRFGLALRSSLLTVPFQDLSLQVAHVGKLLGDRSEPIICGNIAQLTRSVGHTGPKHVSRGRRLIRRGRLGSVA